MDRRSMGVAARGLLAGGGLPQVGSPASDQAVARFYREVGAKQYAQAYQESGPELRDSASQEQFIHMMQQIAEALGSCGAPAKTMNFRINVSNLGTTR